jgi:hypothetical protein
MPESRIDLDKIVHWLRSTESMLGGDTHLAAVKETNKYLPAALADFNGQGALGRITCWVSGHVNFEVIRWSDGQLAFFQHVEIHRLDDPSLQRALAAFVAALVVPRMESAS